MNVYIVARTRSWTESLRTLDEVLIKAIDKEQAVEFAKEIDENRWMRNGEVELVERYPEFKVDIGGAYDVNELAERSRLSPAKLGATPVTEASQPEQ